jgi:hypothetical protein
MAYPEMLAAGYAPQQLAEKGRKMEFELTSSFRAGRSIRKKEPDSSARGFGQRIPRQSATRVVLPATLGDRVGTTARPGVTGRTA